MDKKKRAKRTNASQMEAIVNFISENRVMVTGKSHPLATNTVEKKWDELVEMLNGIDGGARKTKEKWKAFFAEWKSKTRLKARKIQREFTVTGGGSPVKLESLTELENRLLGVLGLVSVLGCPTLPEEINPEENIIIEQNDDNIIIEEVQITEDIPPPQNTNEETTPVTARVVHSKKKKSLDAMDINGTTVAGKKRKLHTRSNQLQKSADVYLKGSETMAVAITCMAEAIKDVASAMVKLASALKRS